MRKILIIGTGQAGLQLGLSLQAEGYEVTIMSARTPQEIRTGRIMSTQAMFAPALQRERERGLNLWEDHAPKIGSIHVTVADLAGTPALSFAGPFDHYAQSVDQRVKMSGWLELFEQRGGRVIYHMVMTSELEELCALHELTIIAAGKGELVELFDPDPSRSPYTAPQRALACIYVHGMKPRPDHPTPHVGINVIPGIAELFTIPALIESGPCDILFWEAIPGGRLDCFTDRPDPQAHLDRTLELMRQYVPWEYGRCGDLEPTDGRCTLVGGYSPIVRHPVGRLSDTAFVLGMADVVVANDPICGQGANNACYCAGIYLDSILERGERSFTPEWMQATFDAFWEYARYPTAFSNMMLGPLPDHVQRALGAAASNRRVAHRFANGYAYPADFDDWLMDAASTDTYLAAVAEGANQ